MRKVYKYPFEVADLVTLRMPDGAKVLDVQVQNGVPCLWVLVDPHCPNIVTYSFRLAGTGHPLPDDIGPHIATFQMGEGALVFHLFYPAPAV